MGSAITEYPVELATELEIEEMASRTRSAIVPDILDVPVNKLMGPDSPEELSFVHITWE